MSAEHYFSKSVLKLIGGVAVFIGGVPWVAHGTTRQIPIGRMTANILCSRHNSALSPLDTSAARLFQQLQDIMDKINARSLSRKDSYYLFSGEEFELWVLKVLCGMFFSRNAASQGTSLLDAHSMDRQAVHDWLELGFWRLGCGLYMHKGMAIGTKLYNAASFTCLVNPSVKKITGCRIAFAGFEFDLYIDPTAVLQEAGAYRPSYLAFKNGLKRHIVKLTWSPATTTNYTVSFHVRPGPRPPTTQKSRPRTP